MTDRQCAEARDGTDPSQADVTVADEWCNVSDVALQQGRSFGALSQRTLDLRQYRVFREDRVIVASTGSQRRPLEQCTLGFALLKLLAMSPWWRVPPSAMLGLVASAPQFSRSMTDSGVATLPAMTKVCGSRDLMSSMALRTLSACPWAMSHSQAEAPAR